MALELKNVVNDWKGLSVDAKTKAGFRTAVDQLKNDYPEMFDIFTRDYNTNSEIFTSGCFFGVKMARTMHRASIDVLWGGEDEIKDLIWDACGLSFFLNPEEKQKYFDRIPADCLEDAMEKAMIFPEGFDRALGMVMFITNFIREDLANAVIDGSGCQLNIQKELTNLYMVDEEDEFGDVKRQSFQNAVEEAKKENPQTVRLLKGYYNLVPIIFEQAFNFGAEMASKTVIAPIERVAGSREGFLKLLWDAEAMSVFVEKECMNIFFDRIEKEELNKVIQAAEINPGGFYTALRIVKTIGEMIRDEAFKEIGCPETTFLKNNVINANR